ncbi:MAG TPA: hypothetical protein VFL59_15130 [Candidatus Nanopelagicales bacterium]|nr:hypothetical protein [Candidatus Nanopelagicales bacterium]
MAEPDGPDQALALDVVRLYGNNDGRPWFAGVLAGETGDEIVVFRRPNVDFDGAVAHLVPDGVHVTFVDAPHTRAELLEAREEVFDLTDELHVVDVRLPTDGSTLAVSVEGPVEDADVVLSRRVPGLARAVPHD